MSRLVLLFVAAAGLWSGSVLVEGQANALRTETPELFYYPSGQFLQEAALGYNEAVADIAWIRTIQYYGEHKKTDQRFDLMFHLCDVITDLDPKFEEPYVFGSFVLFTDAGRPRDGLRLLRKGALAYPDSWKLNFELGFVYYIGYKDYVAASRYFSRAASAEGAPHYAKSFAAYMADKSGSPEASMLLWLQLAESTDNPVIKETAEKNAARLKEEIEAGQKDGKS